MLHIYSCLNTLFFLLEGFQQRRLMRANKLFESGFWCETLIFSPFSCFCSFITQSLYIMVLTASEDIIIFYFSSLIILFKPNLSFWGYSSCQPYSIWMFILLLCGFVHCSTKWWLKYTCFGYCAQIYFSNLHRYAEVMGYGIAEATGWGFVYFVVSIPRVFSLQSCGFYLLHTFSRFYSIYGSIVNLFVQWPINRYSYSPLRRRSKLQSK